MNLSVRLSGSGLRDFTCMKFHHQFDKRFMCQLSKENPKTNPFFTLLGPPEIYRSNPTVSTGDASRVSTAEEPSPNKVTTGDPFMDLMVSKYNCISPPPLPSPFMGFTENRSPTLLTSGNPCLDFFFHVVPDTPSTAVTRRLQAAWYQDPLTALKLVCNLRGVRGTGKSDREGFYASALWLHENHPKTLACNSKSVAEFGYYKDLLEILYRLLYGREVREIEQKGRRDVLKKKDSNGRCILYNKSEYSYEERRIAAGKKAAERYTNDPVYRFLHDQVSNVFAEQLKSDLEKLNSGKLNKLSLAAKWCPSLYSSFDRHTLVCESIARRMFPRDKYPEYEEIEDAHYAYRVRDRLRKQVLAPLRKALELPEVYMSDREWNLLPYNRVPSVAMKNYNDIFLKHDEKRFKKYLEDVKGGKTTIAAGALLPHEIIASAKETDSEVADLQWKRVVQDVSAKGKLKNCLAISDVSGSMCGTPLEVSVALGLLVSELSEEPWKGKLITFSENPRLQKIRGKTLRSKINSIELMNWDMNTDFQKVFDKILKVARQGKLSEEQMIKRLFVFSDMEFDQASLNPWETDYEAIVRKYKKNGYESVPEIVFWNLRESKATPVPSHQKGVALVSGFSKNLLKMFIEDDGILNPAATMELAISGKEYDQLLVVD